MELINQSGAVIGILTLFVGAGVYLFTIGKRGRADIVRQDNIDLRSSNQELRTERAGCLATIEQQADTIKNLREVATQTPAVTQLLTLTSKQQAITADQHTQVITQLTELTTEMSKLTKEFSHVATAIAKNSKAQRDNTLSREK